MSRKRRIIFTNNKQSDQGIMSVILGSICALSLLYSTIYSYRVEGEVSIRFGAALFITLIFGVVGISLGVYAWRDVNKFKLLPTIGIVLNGITVIVLAFLLSIGLR